MIFNRIKYKESYQSNLISSFKYKFGVYQYFGNAKSIKCTLPQPVNVPFSLFKLHIYMAENPHPREGKTSGTTCMCRNITISHPVEGNLCLECKNYNLIATSFQRRKAYYKLMQDSL